MIRVLLFGAAADRAGTRETELPVEEGVTLAELWTPAEGDIPTLPPMRTPAFATTARRAETRASRPAMR